MRLIYLYYDVSIYIVLSLFILIFTFFYLLILLLLSNKFWDSILFSKLNSSAKLKPFLVKLRIFESLDKAYFYKMLLISFLFYSCFLIQYALLVSAFSNHYDLIHYLWAGNLIMFVKTIIPPISFGELGIREGASVYFDLYREFQHLQHVIWRTLRQHLDWNRADAFEVMLAIDQYLDEVIGASLRGYFEAAERVSGGEWSDG